MCLPGVKSPARIGVNGVILGHITQIMWEPIFLMLFDLRTYNQQKKKIFGHFPGIAPPETESTILKHPKKFQKVNFVQT